MNKTFHARFGIIQLLYMMILCILMGYGYWDKQLFVAIPFTILTIFFIERIINTTYTLTPDKKLLIRHGRFSRTKTIDITSINIIEKSTSKRIGPFSLVRYVLIHYEDSKYIAIQPYRDDEFIREVREKM